MKKYIVFLSMLVFGTGAAHAFPAVIDSFQRVGQMGLAWSDEFNGTSLDTVNNWSYDTTYPAPNGEQEHYKRACVEVSNGTLKIWSRLNMYGVQYSSGRIDTHDKRIFTYGYFEAAIQGPIGTGGKNGPALWSAVWLLGNSINHGVAWPTCGEMELYEQRTGTQQEGGSCYPSAPGDNLFIGTCHYGNGGGGAIYNSCAHDYGKCLCDGFHKYGILWDTTNVKYYFDDVQFWGPNLPSGCGTPSITQSVNQVAFSAPFFWIINSAIGGNYQGQNIDQSSFPLHLDLDYVRVYQRGFVPTGVIVNGVNHMPLRSCALVNPATAQLKVYDVSGKVVADYSSALRQMKTGDKVMNLLPSTLPNGVYVARLYDGGRYLSQRFVTAK